MSTKAKKGNKKSLNKKQGQAELQIPLNPSESVKAVKPEEEVMHPRYPLDPKKKDGK